MSEFDDKLNALLSDPDRMAQIMQMAQSLSGGFSSPEQPQAAPQPEQPTQVPPSPPFNGGNVLSSLMGGVDANMLMKLIPLIQELSSDSSSNARTLLYALRPYLKPERQDRIERSLQLAKLLRIGKKFFTSWEG